jgi:hypothetical protein
MAFVTTLYAEPVHWDTPTADYISFQTTFPCVGDAGKTHHENHDALAGLAFHSPTVGALMLAGDNAVDIMHSLSVHTPDPMHASPYDNKLMLLIGNNLATVSPIVVVN